MKDAIKKAWEKRGRLWKDEKVAVLHKSLPLAVNNYIHRIHLDEIVPLLPRKKCRCLDVGCGYGRIAQEAVLYNPKAFIYGIDIAPTFVHLFNKKLGKRGEAIVADVRKLPFGDNYFDFVWMIATLMYLEKKSDQEQAIREIFRVLKPGGTIIIIEDNSRGMAIVELWGLIPSLMKLITWNKTDIRTGGISFSWNAIDALVVAAGGNIKRKRGYPFLTFFLTTLILIEKIFPLFTQVFLDVIGRLDKKFHGAYVSYFVSYVAQKKS